jgi:hypothetical protein
MLTRSSISRRFLLQASAGAAGLAAFAASPVKAAAMGDWSKVLDAARGGLQRVGARALHRDVVGVADFGQASATPRFHLVDMASGKIDTLLVAHGRGSDPYKTGWLSMFSNEFHSDATSRGDFVTGDYYTGAHGRSMRLIGLDATNCNAESRGIVVHSAWYVGPSVVEQQGMLGRSEGCFALSDEDLPKVLERLGSGRVLVSGKL